MHILLKFFYSKIIHFHPEQSRKHQIQTSYYIKIHNTLSKKSKILSNSHASDFPTPEIHLACL
jgi:hypothetical protein